MFVVIWKKAKFGEKTKNPLVKLRRFGVFSSLLWGEAHEKNEIASMTKDIKIIRHFSRKKPIFLICKFWCFWSRMTMEWKYRSWSEKCYFVIDTMQYALVSAFSSFNILFHEIHFSVLLLRIGDEESSFWENFI